MTVLLQHLEDAEMVEFEIRNEQPGVKYTTDGRAGWTPISIIETIFQRVVMSMIEILEAM